MKEQTMLDPSPQQMPEKHKRNGWFENTIQRIGRHFGDNTVPYLLLVLFVLFIIVAMAPRIFVSIYPGELGVLYSRFGGGTVTDRVYGEGFHIIAPWDVLTKYNVRIQQEPLTIKVLSKEALPILISISIRYYPEKSIVGFLHADVGPNYKEKIVNPEVVSVLRSTAGQYTAEELYSSPLPFQQAVNKSLEQIARKYIVLDGVAVISVELPKKVRDAIDSKLSEQQAAQAYKYKIERETLEAERKEIEANGIRNYNNTVGAVSPSVLKWKGIEATKELAKSKNAKVVVIGNGAKDMPIILGGE